MSLVIKIFFSFLLYFLLCISSAFAVNKISVFGTTEDMDGQLLSDALITLKNQNKSAVTNRFGEFDLGKIFPDDTIIVTLKGFQKNQFVPSSNMKIKLIPKSLIQEQINNICNSYNNIHAIIVDDKKSTYEWTIRNEEIDIEQHA